MKIEFEIEKEDAITLIRALEYAASKTENEQTFNSLQNIIEEVKEDVKNGAEVFKELKRRLKPYTDKSEILEESKFRTQLGISRVFINSNRGMIALLNHILQLLVRFHKPNANLKRIKKTEIDDSNTIKDLVNLIIDHYESSN